MLTAYADKYLALRKTVFAVRASAGRHRQGAQSGSLQILKSNSMPSPLAAVGASRACADHGVDSEGLRRQLGTGLVRKHYGRTRRLGWSIDDPIALAGLVPYD